MTDPRPADFADEPLRASRRRAVLDSLGVLVGALSFGFVYGLTARTAGFSVVEAAAMSLLAFGGAAQFAAIGYVTSGLGWPAIALLTAFLNARHLLYSAVLAPWLTDRPRLLRAGMAHLLTDEAFALSIAHFRRIGRTDLWVYALGGIAMTFIPWNLASFVGSLVGGGIPDPSAFGIDIVFPATMAGLAVGLIAGRREIVAAAVGVGVGVGVGLVAGKPAGIVAGAIFGPVVALLLPLGPERAEAAAEVDEPFEGPPS